MATKPMNPREQLRKFADLYIDELLGTTEKELLDDALSEPCLTSAGEMAKEAYIRAQKAAGKLRLEAARRALGEHKANDNKPVPSIDIAKARALLKRISANDPSFGTRFTLAARNLGEISDVEIVSIMNDLRALGVPLDDLDL